MRRYWILAVVLLLFLIGSGLFLYTSSYLVMKCSTSTNTTETTVEVAYGTSVEGALRALCGDSLFSNCHILLPSLKVYVWIKNIFSSEVAFSIRYGEYEVLPKMSLLSLLNKMHLGHSKQYKVTFPEGIDVYDVVKVLNDLSNIKKSPIPNSLLEGYLMPDTYFYTKNNSVADLIEEMRMRMSNFVDEQWEKRDRRIDKVIKSKHDLLTLASIVEKESGIIDEMRMIAGVYMLRLEKGIPIQSCPTVLYAVKLRDRKNNKDIKRDKLYYKDLKHDSIYNTYIRKGLPPYPICNPGKLSIDAVLHPVWNDNLYFVALGNGRHVFSQSFEAHKRNKSIIKNQKRNVVDKKTSKDNEIRAYEQKKY